MHLEVPRSDTAGFTTPDIVQKGPICLSNSSAHAQGVVPVNMLLVWLVAGLSSNKVLRQRSCVAKALKETKKTEIHDIVHVHVVSTEKNY